MLNREELLTLTASAEFQAIFRADPVLDELEKQKYDRTAEVFNLLAALGQRDFRIGDLPVQPITAALWAVLWALDSAFTRDGAKAETGDVETALYLLSRGVRRMDCALAEIPVHAIDTLQRSGMDADEAEREVRSMIALAFRPLQCFPHQPGAESTEVHYDAEWLTSVASVAVRESGMSFRRVIFDLPLSLVHWFCVNAAKRNDVNRVIHRRGDTEINKAMIERAYELGEAFLNSTGVRHPAVLKNKITAPQGATTGATRSGAQHLISPTSSLLPETKGLKDAGSR